MSPLSFSRLRRQLGWYRRILGPHKRYCSIFNNPRAKARARFCYGNPPRQAATVQFMSVCEQISGTSSPSVSARPTFAASVLIAG
jgi:hypothetical protein